MRSRVPTLVIGDVHGRLRELEALLERSGIVDAKGRWAAGEARLWFIGDFVDRGPDGIGVIDLVMRLESEAEKQGGAVRSLLGNHEVMFLAAAFFGRDHRRLLLDWVQFGGRKEDLDRLTDEHVDWICSLPAMAAVGDALLVHADADFYLRYGSSIAGVNSAIRETLLGDQVEAWFALISRFGARNAFRGRRGRKVAEQFLQRFGGRVLVHGHTPIHVIEGGDAPSVTEPLIYGKGACMNVDGGMYAGGPGFVAAL